MRSRSTALAACWLAAGACRRDTASVSVSRPRPIAACDSPYLPARPGLRWTYEITYPGLATAGDAGAVGGRFTQRVAEVHPGGFTLEQRWPYVVQRIPWQCRPEGLVALEHGGETTQTDREGHGAITFRTESVEGVNLPSPLPQPGGSWNVTYRVRGSGTTHAGATVDSRSVYASTYTVAGPEHVTVRGTDYDSVRLRVSTTIRTEARASDRPLPVTSTLTEEGSSWYVADVGWVRSALTSHGAAGAPVESVTELVRVDMAP